MWLREDGKRNQTRGSEIRTQCSNSPRQQMQKLRNRNRNRFFFIGALDIGFLSCAAHFDEFHTHSICCYLLIKGNFKTINHQNVLQMGETMNISVFSVNRWNECEIHQMLRAENCTNNSSSSDFFSFFFKRGGQMSGNNQFPMWRVRLKDTLSKMKERVTTG